MLISTALDGFILARSADGYSQSTINLYTWTLHQLIEFTGDVNVSNVTVDDLRRFLATMYGRGYKPASIDNHWKGIRAFFGWCAAELHTGRPDAGLARPRYKSAEIQPFTSDEIRAILRACERKKPAETTRRASWQALRPTRYRDTAIILVLLDTGMRAGELRRLTPEDVNLKSGEIHIAPFGSGRKTTPRTVYVGKSTQRALWRYLADREPMPTLFTSQFGRALSESALRDVLVELGKRAGVRGVHAHRFRHTFATVFLRNGGSIYSLQILLGHSSLEMVRRYLHIVETDVATAHNRASPVDRWGL